MKNTVQPAYYSDTIAAISTPPGEGGIGIVRLSGPDTLKITQKIFLPFKNNFINPRSHSLIYGNIISPESKEIIDEVLLSTMRAPYSYTREDVVEINCHGGLLPLTKILQLVLEHGARLAEPGEFTKRAFLNGRIDLAQAEAVIDIIRSKTEESMRHAAFQLQGKTSGEITLLRNLLIDLRSHLELSIDFIEDDLEIISKNKLLELLYQALEKIDKLLSSAKIGRILREGIKIAIIGRPNVGKSSLLNRLLNEERAIVTHIPGTTRDIIEETININGIPAAIIDTAGIRKTTDEVEKLGIERTRMSIHQADIVLLTLDVSEKLHEEDIEIIKEIKNKKTIYVLNKIDKIFNSESKSVQNFLDLIYEETFSREIPHIQISSLTGEGIENLKKLIYNLIINKRIDNKNDVFINNIRHEEALKKAGYSLLRAIEGVKSKLSPEFIASDVKEASENLGIITGKTFTEDILDNIFKNFCIGK
ncbi:tRNA uridine-5-carboxymethylaminomethyl(34) synthesis GTPase MnmE [Candidatus Desantisbacteria bacterium]|nr:tRNA uridine-5-carboxymethylaminomethyl(34) synthesis GTPase MnmE [Candidatus Desantisbacteria bacterium]